MNTATANHIALFQLVDMLTKSNRIHEIFHTVKKDRDAYFDEKRSAAEIVILSELKKITAAKNILLRKQLIMDKRLANIEKAMDAMIQYLEMDTFPFHEVGIEYTPTANEADEQVKTMINQEVAELDKRIDNREMLVENETQLRQELYGSVSVPDPDASLVIDEEVELSDSQKAAKERREMISKDATKTRHSYDLHDGAWNYRQYLDLIKQVNSRPGAETEVCEPADPAKFRRRYGKDWEPHMTKVSDFDVPRSKTRGSKPKEWEARANLEEAQTARLAKRIRLATIPEERLTLEDKDELNDSFDTVNSYSEFKEESPETSEGSSFYISDWEQPSTSRNALKKFRKTVNKAINSKPSATSSEESLPRRSFRKRKNNSNNEGEAPPEKKPKHKNSISGKVVKAPKKNTKKK